jgi:hypothetical protein
VVPHLKGCHAFHNLQLTGKASAADLVPAEKFASDNYKTWIFAPASIQSALLYNEPDTIMINSHLLSCCMTGLDVCTCQQRQLDD